MKKIRIPFLAVLLSVFCISAVFGQVDKKSKSINWMTFEEVEEALKKEKKKVFVDVYTKWCGWCKKMDKSTFKKKHIVQYVNDNFYAIKFDAEYKKDITIDGKTYKFIKGEKGQRGYHELAAAITKGRLSFPTSVFLNDNLSLIQPIPGYLDEVKFEVIMTYFAENQHRKTPWTTYQKTYTPMKSRDPLKVPTDEKKVKRALTPVSNNKN